MGITATDADQLIVDQNGICAMPGCEHSLVDDQGEKKESE